MFRAVIEELQIYFMGYVYLEGSVYHFDAPCICFISGSALGSVMRCEGQD